MLYKKLHLICLWWNSEHNSLFQWKSTQQTASVIYTVTGKDLNLNEPLVYNPLRNHMAFQQFTDCWQVQIYTLQDTENRSMQRLKVPYPANCIHVFSFLDCFLWWGRCWMQLSVQFFIFLMKLHDCMWVESSMPWLKQPCSTLNKYVNVMLMLLNHFLNEFVNIFTFYVFGISWKPVYCAMLMFTCVSECIIIVLNQVNEIVRKMVHQ